MADPPIARSPAEPLMGAPKAADTQSLVASGGRVLVVDDDECLRKSLVQVLAHNGYQVIQAEDGEVALVLLAARPVDVLILDLAMPQLDGVSVLKELEAPKPRVILHSAFEYFSMEQLKESGVSSRVFRSLHKPVPVQRLLRAVADALSD